MRIQSQAFNVEKEYRLSASLEADFFSAILIDENNQVDLLLHEFHFDRLSGTMFEFDKLNIISKKAVISYFPAVLVPKPEFQEKKKESYLTLYDPFLDINDIQSHTFSWDDYMCVYSTPKKWLSYNLSALKGVEIYHLLERILDRIRAVAETGVFVHWMSNRMYLVVFNKGELQLAQTYDFKEPADAVYYILSAYQLIDLDPLQDPVYFSGRIENNSDLMNKLSGFITEFKWLSNPELVVPDDIAFSSHLFFHL